MRAAAELAGPQAVRAAAELAGANGEYLFCICLRRFKNSPATCTRNLENNE